MPLPAARAIRSKSSPLIGAAPGFPLLLLRGLCGKYQFIHSTRSVLIPSPVFTAAPQEHYHAPALPLPLKADTKQAQKIKLLERKREKRKAKLLSGSACATIMAAASLPDLCCSCAHHQLEHQQETVAPNQIVSPSGYEQIRHIFDDVCI